MFTFIFSLNFGILLILFLYICNLKKIFLILIIHFYYHNILLFIIFMFLYF